MENNGCGATGDLPYDIIYLHNKYWRISKYSMDRVVRCDCGKWIDYRTSHQNHARRAHENSQYHRNWMWGNDNLSKFMRETLGKNEN